MMGIYEPMTAERLQPDDRVLDVDGDVITITEVRRIGPNVALIDDEGIALILPADEHLWADTVLPRVWRYDATACEDYGVTRRLYVESVKPGDLVTVPDGQTIDVMGVAVVAGVVTLYEGGEPARTLDAGTIVEVTT
jgi:hypothetical protein